MKTTLIIAVLFFVSFTLFSQETGAGYTEKMQPITISELSEKQYEETLLQAYVDLLAQIVEHPDIDQNKKEEAFTWKPQIKILNGELTKGILIFPQGTITVDNGKNTRFCLSRNFNEWSGNEFKIWDIFPFGNDSNPAYDISR